MIERKFIQEKYKEFEIEEFIAKNMRRVGHSHTKIVKTPLGEKVSIYSSRPGLIVGRKGANIKKLTKTLKKKFGLENPQIEIAEVEDVNLDPHIVAERISNSLERFGTSKFKGIGHKVLTDVMNAGALGIEVLISGKIPSARAKKWRFYQGYLKKCGDIAMNHVKKAYTTAELKTGTVGIQVRIMTPDIILPDTITITDVKEEIVEEVSISTDATEEKTEKKPKKKTAAKPRAKKKKEETADVEKEEAVKDEE